MELARELNRLESPGIAVEPNQFTPDASKFKGELCHGVRFILTSRQSAVISHLGIALTHTLHTLHRLYQPDFDIAKVNRLLRSESIIQPIKNNKSIPTIQSTITHNHPDFLNRLHQHLLYP